MCLLRFVFAEYHLYPIPTHTTSYVVLWRVMTFSCYGVIDHTNEKSIYPCISHDVKYRHIIFPKLHAYNYILLWFWYELILYDCMWSTPDEYPWIHRMNHQGLISKSHYYVYKTVFVIRTQENEAQHNRTVCIWCGIGSIKYWHLHEESL